MESGSPQRNSEPLLNESSIPIASRTGGYAPPSSSQASSGSYSLNDSHHQPAPPAPNGRQEAYDLHLTATDERGQIVSSPTAEYDNDLPRLPPLVSYCSYVRYGCVFGKWFLLVAVVNVIALCICLKDGYFNYNGYWPVEDWRGGLLASVWLLTACFFFLSAKTIERDVQRVDHMAQYEQGRLSDDNDNGYSDVDFVLNYENIYGQVSRKVDSAFTPKRSSSSNSTDTPAPPEGTSSLVNLSYAFWAGSFAAAIFLGTMILLGKYYANACDNKNIPDGRNATNSMNKNDYARISNYHDHVQDWIVERRDPWRYEMRIDYQDDRFDDYGRYFPTYDFPTAYSTDMGGFASMKDGTVFFAGQLPMEHDVTNADDDSETGSETGGYKYGNHLVLVESPGNGGPARYYRDIINPRMFVPVENTLTKNNRGNTVATQYCFTSAKEKSERKKSRRSWDATIRISPIHCIITQGGTIATNSSSFEIKKVNIAWKDKSQRGPQVTAASTGGEVLVAHTAVDNRYRRQEVVSVNPSSMSTTSIYHLTSEDTEDFYVYDEGREKHQNTRCIQDHVQVFSVVAAMVVLVLCGLWLILREGVPAGVSPLALALVGLLRCFTGQYDAGTTTMSLTFGTLFFHCILCCDNGRVCHLPAWIGRDMYIWGLYSWILSFFAMDFMFRMSDAMVSSAIFFGLSGIILNHPIPHLMGYACIAIASLNIILWPFFGRYSDGIFIAALLFFLGFGMIGAGNCFSKNRRYCAAFCRPISRAGRTMFYGSASGANAPSSSHSTPVVTQV